MIHSSRTVRRIALGTSLACLLAGSSASIVACGPQHDVYGGYYEEPGSTSDFEADGGGVFTGDGGPSEKPMLVKIDPAATMVQTPGQGVGVFTQYEPASDGGAKGHWYIWWTCDTSISSEPCDFAISASVAQGDITSATSQGFAAGDELTGGGIATSIDGGEIPDGSAASASSISASTTTTTTVQGIRFDTDAGAVVTLSAALGGEYSGSFLFFVQDGQVNGGYTGELSDPMELQSTSP